MFITSYDGRLLTLASSRPAPVCRAGCQQHDPRAEIFSRPQKVAPGHRAELVPIVRAIEDCEPL